MNRKIKLIMEKLRNEKILFLVIKILISFAILYYVLSKLNIQKIIEVISRINYFYIILAGLLLLITLVLMTLKWNIFLKKYVNIKFKHLFWIYWASDFANLFGLGNIGGETYKTIMFDQKKKALFSSLVNKGYTIIWFGLYAISIFISFIIFNRILIVFISSILLFLILFFIFTLIYYPLNRGISKIIKIEVIKKILNESLIKKSDLFLHSLLCLLFVFNTTLIYSLIFYSLGLPIKIPEIAVLTTFVFIGVTLPISIQGLGVREFLFLKFAMLTNISSETVVVASLSIYLCMLIYSLFGLIPFLVLKKR